MGRKFRTNKHKKLKSVDPNYKGVIVKDTGINRQPDDIYAQEVPRKMLEIFKQSAIYENKDRIRGKTKHKKERSDKIKVKVDKLEATQPGMKKELPNIPEVMEQGEYESEFRFINRINEVALKAIAETKMEEKYGIGEQTDKQIIAEADGKDVDPKSKKKLKKKLYIQKKKDKVQAKIDRRVDEFHQFQDKVKFGEVAMEPPTLRVVKKIVKVKATTKPGQRSLLLKNNLKNLPAEVTQSLNLSGHNRSIDLTKKRKDLSLSQRARLENERLEAVQLYRQLKKDRNKKKVKKV